MKRYLLFALVLVCSVPAAQARRDNLRHDNVVIEKGQTVKEDIATDGFITVNGVLDGDAVSIGGASVTVNGELTGDLVALGGAVYIPGLVGRDVAAIGGPVEITGKVSGDVTSVGGRISLSGSGEVDGDISVIGGGVAKGGKTIHRGEVRSLNFKAARNLLPRLLKLSGEVNDQKKAVSPWLIGGLVGAGLAILFSLLATGIVMLLLPAIFFPKNVEKAAESIAGDMWRTCGIGALIVMGFFPGLLMMTISILGIPLIPFALMLFAAAMVLGLSAFSVVLQGRFFEGIKKPGPSGLPGKVAAGYAVMAGLLLFGKLIPFIGGVLSFIGFMLMAFGTVIGLGAAWTTRMGNKGRAVSAAQPVYQQPAPPVQ